MVYLTQTGKAHIVAVSLIGGVHDAMTYSTKQHRSVLQREKSVETYVLSKRRKAQW